MSSLSSVLIVDDEPSVRALLSRWVESLGLQPRTAANAEEAMDALRARHSDLAVIDIMMPGNDGLWLASELRRLHPDTAVVIATGNESMVRDDQTEIADLLIKPFKRDRFVLAVDRGRQWRRQAVEELEWQTHLSEEVRARIADVQREVQRGMGAGRNGVMVLLELAAARMPKVIAHSERVVRYTTSIVRELNLGARVVDLAEQAARFHDIGKMAVPDAILTKPSRLTPGEVVIMRGHVEAGVEILQSTPTLAEILPIVQASHEWFGGHGYPNGLSRTDIPITSRIIAVADAYDAMTRDRSYRSGLDAIEATSELLRCSPCQFDPDVVVAFLKVVGRH